MAKPFKPPPLEDQIIDTINPRNWFSGLIWSNFQGDIDYHLSARDHSKVQGLPPISPVDLKEGAGFGPASLSIDPRKWFKYGLTNGIKSNAKNLLKWNFSLEEIDDHNDWIHGWKPKLIQEVNGSNTNANEMGLVRKVKGVTGEILQGWTDDSTRSTLSDKEKQVMANEKESRLNLFNKLEWWTKTEHIKPYRDMAWTPLMESAIEAAYFTAERQRDEGTITQAEFDHFKTEFDRVVNKKDPASLRKKLNDAKDEAKKKGLTFKNTEASLTDVKDMLNPNSEKRKNYFETIRQEQDYNTDLHILFSKITAHDHHHRIINLERDENGRRLITNLLTLDHGEKHFAWKDFLQKFDKGGTLRDNLWDSLTSTDLILIAEPIYEILTGGKTMPIETYKFLGRLSQVSAKTFPFNAGHLIASSNGVFQYVFQSIEDPQKYLTPPLSFQYYVNRTIDNNILTKPVYAETFGGGALDVVFGVWKYFRNLAYLVFVVVIIMVGFMVMFRKQIDPHTIVTVQSAIPSFFIVLLLITFSYGIGSLAVSSIGPLYGALKNVGHLGTWNNVTLGYGVLMILIVIKFVGVLFVTGAIPIVGISLLIVFLALLICVVIAGIMYAIEYVKRLVKLIMLTVMAPVILLFGAIPGQSNFISHWFKGIIANVLALPLMYMVIKIGIMIMLSDNENVAWYDFGAGLLNIVIGLVVMFWSAKIPKMVEDMFGYDGSLIPSSDPKRH